MSNDYYDHTTFPAFGSQGSSATARAEFDAVEAGFDKLVDLTSNASKVVAVNAGGTAQEGLSTTGTGNVVLATDPTFTLTDVATNNASTVQHGWLPKLDGSATKFLTGAGTWTTVANISTVKRSARTSNTILGTADAATLIDITSGTFTQTFTAVATLADGWWCYIRNSGTGDITLDPNASEQIDSLTSYIMYPGETRAVICTGAALYTIVVSVFFRNCPTSITFTKPPGYRAFGLFLTGAGGGGGSGERQSTTTTRGGGAGGGTGAIATSVVESSLVGATETVTVGAFGTGGIAVTVDTTSGNNGIAGGNTSFGTHLLASGGIAGAGSAGAGGASSAGRTGFPPNSTTGTGFNSATSGGGGASSAPTAGTATTAGLAAAGSGGGAGQAGGSTTNVAGAVGGAVVAATTTSGRAVALSGGAGGTTGGVAAVIGDAAPTDSGLGGAGSGGGAYRTGQVGGTGAKGSKYGGGGGGGAASDNSHNSGAGGDGEDGYAKIWGIV